MRNIVIIILCLTVLYQGKSIAQDISKNKSMKLNKLTPEEEDIIIRKSTEYPYSGKYVNFNEDGVYICKQCNAPLYRSNDKFNAHCGWPSFDDEISGAILRTPDFDGERTEIVCAKCGAHLGHVFLGEGLTPTDTRHCVNSISLNFISKKQATEERANTAYFASGCFWGTEYHFNRYKGVLQTTVGYMGGKTENATYDQVKTGKTGHAETIEVVFDASKTSYEGLVKLFFETHDFTQVNRQGPDVGTQYRSVIFYTNEEQKSIAEDYKDQLTKKGYKVATEILPAPEHFWKGENVHQNYYDKRGGVPYCHVYRKIF